MTTAPAGPRRRRTAEEARAEILAAAERRLAAAGPDALRLQDLAADLGVSHPAVLHHFGTREEIVHAVVERAVRRLEQSLLDIFREAGDGPPDGVALLARVFDLLGRGGYGRLMAWLMLSGHDALDAKAARAGWRAITDAAHARRPAAAPREDTQFTVVLAALATFGQAVAGDKVFDMAGLGGDADAPARFGRWLAQLLGAHLGRGGAPASAAREARAKAKRPRRGARVTAGRSTSG